MPISDQHIECIDCGRTFTWTVGEQRFYRERGLSAPKRCAECRQRKHGSRQASVFDRPDVRYGLFLSSLALGLGLLVLWRAPSLRPVQGLLLAVNVVSFWAFAYDKLTAKVDAERVPESILLGMSALGGAPGAAAGMLVFRHKTAKARFKMRLLGILMLQVFAGIAYLLLTA